MSDDFLARESELLGDEFSVPSNTGGSFATATGGDEIDFDAAASAFPDISLDGDLNISAAAPPAAAAPSRGFSFDDFDSPRERTTEVKVTGDDEIEQFESDFPEIELPSVSVYRAEVVLPALTSLHYTQEQPSFTSPLAAPSFGATPPFAPRPQPSAFASTPILNQQVQEEEPEVIKYVRKSHHYASETKYTIQTMAGKASC